MIIGMIQAHPTQNRMARQAVLAIADGGLDVALSVDTWATSSVL
jgi:hypothetical protein